MTATLVAVLLVGAPVAGIVAPMVVPSPIEDDEEGGAPSELVVDAAPWHHVRRLIERHPPDQSRSAVIPPHRHHAILVHPQAAPVTFRSAANSPLHC